MSLANSGQTEPSPAILPPSARAAVLSVFITGASSGIGLALAGAFLWRGDRVFGLSRRRPAMAEGIQGFAFESVDLRVAADIEPGLARLLGDVMHLDLVVLNAGSLGPLGDLGDTPLEALTGLMQVNVWANKLILDALARRAVRVDQVVAISSGAALTAERGWNGYAITKAALNRLIALYAAERPETHFCALAPGLVDTAMQRAIRELPASGEFKAFERLKGAAGTAAMSLPDTAAARLLAVFPRLREHPSGSYLDLRKLPDSSRADALFE